MAAILETDIKGARLLNRGKVRDIYEIDDEHLMLVVTDRVSAFDVVLDKPIPDKGAILTQISNFWFERFAEFGYELDNGVFIEQSIVIPDELREEPQYGGMAADRVSDRRWRSTSSSE